MFAKLSENGGRERGVPPSPPQQHQLTFKGWGGSHGIPLATFGSVFIIMLCLMYWIQFMNLIYVIHLMCWNYLIALITHSKKGNNSILAMRCRGEMQRCIRNCSPNEGVRADTKNLLRKIAPNNQKLISLWSVVDLSKVG